MTDNNQNDTDETEDDAEDSIGRDVTLTVRGQETPIDNVEWDLDTVGDNLDALAYALQDASRHALSGTFSFGIPIDEIEGDVTITGSEATETRIENATIKSREQVREEAQEIRANAPPEYDLSDRTTDIDEVITALQRAKEHGVSEVYVNDEGMARSPDPRITNNHVHYHGTGPKPGDLEEWVEL